jgi:hypothetical protein
MTRPIPEVVPVTTRTFLSVLMVRPFLYSAQYVRKVMRDRGLQVNAQNVRYHGPVSAQSFQRARSSESKEQRARSLVDAARAIAAEKGVAAVTLTGIAEAISTAAPSLGQGRALDVVTAANALAATLWQVTHPAAGLRAAFEADPGLSLVPPREFQATVARLLAATCEGLTGCRPASDRAKVPHSGTAGGRPVRPAHPSR